MQSYQPQSNPATCCPFLNLQSCLSSPSQGRQNTCSLDSHSLISAASWREREEKSRVTDRCAIRIVRNLARVSNCAAPRVHTAVLPSSESEATMAATLMQYQVAPYRGKSMSEKRELEVYLPPKILARSQALADTSQPFRLLDLPPEIWSRIGKFAIDNVKRMTWWDLVNANASSRQPSITRTCICLRKELLPYYYCTKIEVIIGWCDLHTWSPWLRALSPASRRLIHGLLMDCFRASRDQFQPFLEAELEQRIHCERLPESDDLHSMVFE